MDRSDGQVKADRRSLHYALVKLVAGQVSAVDGAFLSA